MNRMGCDYKLPGISGTTVDFIVPLLNITLWDFSPVAYHWSGALPQEHEGRSFGRMLIIFSCRGSQKHLLAHTNVSSSYQSIFDECLGNLAFFLKPLVLRIYIIKCLILYMRAIFSVLSCV